MKTRVMQLTQRLAGSWGLRMPKSEKRMVLNNLCFQPKKLEDEEYTKPKASWRKQIRKMSPYISEIENRKAAAEIDETKKLVL